ncbi:hypothetical protein EMMF5_005542 [Cystobasidiomycetes sp. EMM_F5]
MSSSEIAELKKLIQDQAHRIGVLEDTAEIRNLQHAYGFYIDKCHYNEVVDLFTDDGMVIFHGAKWKTKAGVKRLYVDRFQSRFTAGRNGPVHGFLLDHPQLQDIIHVAPDRLSAKMRARSLMQAGRHRDHPFDPANAPTVPRQWWEGGIYENEFARNSVNEPWKIKVLDYHPIWHGDYSEGWSNVPRNYVPFPATLYPQDPAGPDELQSEEEKFLWPDAHTVPFHYAHPVTGEQRPSTQDMRAVSVLEVISALQKKQTNGH